ncbi:hypothetical protein EDD28_0918 [Salana multivorans]|uniref:CopC domain-containing protein n=1 Tax=Salana multivorans TaxID=120377 RepID=A0A3N2D969_9MICO|nr:copper resistance CopC family protein [Salana multivorans]ROR96335.1 hypothetical protein EDD28_0918 [Salana multivorans]
MPTRRWVAAGMLALALVLVAPVAHGHDELVSSVPLAGEVLDEPPTQVVLTMSAEPLEIGTTVMVTDLDGVDHATGLSLSGNDAVVDLADLTEGFYDVRWRVVSSDGHPISGLIPFTVGDVGPRPGADGSPPASAAQPSTDSAPSAPPAPSPGAEDRVAGQGVGRVLGIAAAGAVGALVLWWMVGRLASLRRDRRSHPN